MNYSTQSQPGVKLNQPLEALMALIEATPNTTVELSATLGFVASLEKAGSMDVSFLIDKNYQHLLSQTKAGFIITSNDLAKAHPESKSCFLLVDNPWQAVITLLNWIKQQRQLSFNNNVEKSPIAATANIDTSCQLGHFAVVGSGSSIGADTVIGANSTIGHNVTIGEHCHIGSNVVIEDDTVLGNHVIIGPGSVIGGEGFRHVMIDGVLSKVPQLGNVIIEDKVEIGCNSTIDRAFLESTLIQHHTKIDNLVHIAHNCNIGPNCFIAGGCAIAGSVVVEENCTLFGRVGVADNLTIGKNSRILVASIVVQSQPSDATVFGYPAMDAMSQRKSLHYFKQLPELAKRLKRLERGIDINEKK